MVKIGDIVKTNAGNIGKVIKETFDWFYETRIILPVNSTYKKGEIINATAKKVLPINEIPNVGDKILIIKEEKNNPHSSEGKIFTVKVVGSIVIIVKERSIVFNRDFDKWVIVEKASKEKNEKFEIGDTVRRTRCNFSTMKIGSEHIITHIKEKGAWLRFEGEDYNWFASNFELVKKKDQTINNIVDKATFKQEYEEYFKEDKKMETSKEITYNKISTINKREALKQVVEDRTNQEVLKAKEHLKDLLNRKDVLEYDLRVAKEELEEINKELSTIKKQ